VSAKGLSGISPHHFESSSYLVESQREYSAENLTNIQLSFPWVEGRDGFVSIDRPELYEMNTRVPMSQDSCHSI